MSHDQALQMMALVDNNAASTGNTRLYRTVLKPTAYRIASICCMALSCVFIWVRSLELETSTLCSLARPLEFCDQTRSLGFLETKFIGVFVQPVSRNSSHCTLKMNRLVGERTHAPHKESA